MVGVIKQLYLVLYADHVGIEGPADTACCRQQGVNLALHDVLVVDDLNGRSGKCRSPGDVGLARRRRIDVDEVGGGRCEHEIAGDIEGADRVRHARHQRSAVHRDARRHSGAAERGAGIHCHAAGRRDIAGQQKCAACDGGGPRVAVGAGERQRPSTDLDQRTACSPESAAVADRSADRGAEIVAADRERLRAEEVSPLALDRAGGHPGRAETRHVEYATRLGRERGIATSAELRKIV